jgi:hypothetical protein
MAYLYDYAITLEVLLSPSIGNEIISEELQSTIHVTLLFTKQYNN